MRVMREGDDMRALRNFESTSIDLRPAESSARSAAPASEATLQSTLHVCTPRIALRFRHTLAESGNEGEDGDAGRPVDRCVSNAGARRGLNVVNVMPTLMLFGLCSVH